MVFINKLILSIIFVLSHYMSFLQSGKGYTEQSKLLFHNKRINIVIPYIFLQIITIILTKDYSTFILISLILNCYYNDKQHLMYDIMHFNYVVKKLEQNEILNHNEYSDEVYPL